MHHSFKYNEIKKFLFLLVFWHTVWICNTTTSTEIKSFLMHPHAQCCLCFFPQCKQNLQYVESGHHNQPQDDDCPFIMWRKIPCTACSWHRRGVKALKPAADGRYLMCRSLPCYFSTCTEVHLSSWQQSACWVFSCFRNPPNSDNTWTKGSLTCVRSRRRRMLFSP